MFFLEKHPPIAAPGTLTIAAGALRAKVTAAQAELGNVDFEWYPYGTLSNVPHIERLVGGERWPALLDSARRDGVLDAGCQDGELAFLFESLGCRVTAIDNRATNHNGMRGVQALKERLRSSIELQEMDVDTQFALPEDRNGLAVLLGVLYHLKNPFYAMETLARHSTYCILSTRITRRLTDGSAISPGMPIAYLLDAYELNEDDSNYWIFSEAALRRLLKRSGWGVCEHFTAGDDDSDPVSINRDERAFYLLESHFGLGHLNLIAGWHAVERTGWRWTKKEFSVGLPDAADGNYQRMTMRVFIPPVVTERLGALTLRAELDGQELTPVVFNEPGTHTFVRRLNASAAGPEHVVHFSLNKALYPGDLDHRELGIIVAAIEFD